MANTTANHVAVVFPGNGNQRLGMGKDLYKAIPRVREVYEEASDVLGFDVSELSFEGPLDDLACVELGSVALMTFYTACWRVIEGAGLEPSLLGGASVGEFAAWVAGDGWSFSDALRSVYQCYKLSVELCGRDSIGMLVVFGLSPETVEDLCRESSNMGVASVSGYLGPDYIVVSGEIDALNRLRDLAQHWETCRLISVPAVSAFHCSLMLPVTERLKSLVSDVEFRDLKIPVVSCVEACPKQRGEELAQLFVEQIVQPIRWTSAIRYMQKSGIDLFVRLGFGPDSVKMTLPDATVLSVRDVASLDATLDYLSNQHLI